MAGISGLSESNIDHLSPMYGGFLLLPYHKSNKPVTGKQPLESLTSEYECPNMGFLFSCMRLPSSFIQIKGSFIGKAPGWRIGFVIAHDLSKTIIVSDSYGGGGCVPLSFCWMGSASVGYVPGPPGFPVTSERNQRRPAQAPPCDHKEEYPIQGRTPGTVVQFRRFKKEYIPLP
ncbi:hypothetical protein QL285_030340 [Trifolium repens]|nr:hypothetical protein QL285_030340 [Trifolium repens]